VQNLIGKLIGIGVGPGDPELITLKAAKALKKADIICIPKSHTDRPSMALGMIKPVLDERQSPPEILKLIFPMSTEEINVKKIWEQNAETVAQKVREGKTLIFITLGDPMLYSTFIYLYQIIKENYPEVPIEIIPGITSFTAAAASAKIPLAQKEEVISIVPSNQKFKLIEETAKYSDNFVFMKCAHQIKDLLPVLKKSGFSSDSTVALVRRCTLPEEQVFVGTLGSVENWKITNDYFSLAIVKRSQLKINWKQDESK
jgi:precorrin-2/cobalt-factor-2 C20-methyltransferase